MTQAVALRDALRAAAQQANVLVKAIRAEKRQARFVRSTLASLRSLETLQV